jgi:uncharacterized protein YukE
MKKIIIMALAFTASTASIAQTVNQDEKEVRNIISTIEKGWNSKSGETFASVFAEEHDYIVVNGMYLK